MWSRQSLQITLQHLNTDIVLVSHFIMKIQKIVFWKHLLLLLNGDIINELDDGRYGLPKGYGEGETQCVDRGKQLSV